MERSSTVEDIEAALERVSSSAGRVAAGDASFKDQAYEDIFALNNAIGRLAREGPEVMRRMKELQAFVNMVTVGIKYGRSADVREGLSAAGKLLDSMKRGPPESP
jgi:hypothetical protein